MTTRRSFMGQLAAVPLAGAVPAAAALAAFGVVGPSAASFDADAPLWLLRSRWMEARAAYAAETPPCTHEYAAALASLPSPAGIADREEIARIISIRCDVLDRLPAPQKLSLEAEARQEKAFDDECRAVDAITATRAKTLAGLGFKAEVSTIENHLNPDLLLSIIADLAAFAAAHPTVRI